jgi:ABC-type multidrug transport system fused ATPase/permease subunit
VLDFFDTTTSGRVLNRFASDQQLVDIQLRNQMASLLNSALQVKKKKKLCVRFFLHIIFFFFVFQYFLFKCCVVLIITPVVCFAFENLFIHLFILSLSFSLSLSLSLSKMVAGLVVVIASTPFILLLLLPLGYFYYGLQFKYRTSAREVQRLQSISRSPIFQKVIKAILACVCLVFHFGFYF